MSLTNIACTHCHSQNTACGLCGKTVCLCYKGSSFCYACDSFFSKDGKPAFCFCKDSENPNKVYCNLCKVWRPTGHSQWEWMNKAIPNCECEPNENNKLKCYDCGVIRSREDAPWQFSNRNYEYGYSCNHLNSEVVFLDGRIIVHASSCYQRDLTDETPPDFGLYMDGMWTPMGPAYLLGWKDYGLPYNWTWAAEAILDVYNKATVGKWVEVGCIAGHGRTGTVLACMAVLAGHSAKDAVQYIRSTYCVRSVETKEQEWFVAWFEAYMFGGTTPGRPKPWDADRNYVPEVYEYTDGWINTRENPHLERVTEFDDESITWASRRVRIKPTDTTKKKKKKKLKAKIQEPTIKVP